MRCCALLLLLALGAAVAQTGRVGFISSGPISFTVDADSYVEAAACAGCYPLSPDPGPAVVLDVRRQNRNSYYTLEVISSSWSPASLPLEARYTVTNTRGNRIFLTTDWLAITEVPTQLFTQQVVARENRVRVEVAYRLRLRGEELAGSYLTRVTYRIRENNSAVMHDVYVALPSILALRLIGQVAGTHTLHFDYSEASASYLQAVSDGTPLAITGSDLERVEISTNHPSGYTVTVTVDDLLEGGLRERLWLGNTLAHMQQLSSSEPTRGFITLVSIEDFALFVDGSEPPGDYRLTVRYQALTNP